MPCRRPQFERCRRAPNPWPGLGRPPAGATAVPQTAAFEAAVRFASCEGIIPGPEPAHAIKAALDEAEATKRAGEEDEMRAALERLFAAPATFT